MTAILSRPQCVKVAISLLTRPLTHRLIGDQSAVFDKQNIAVLVRRLSNIRENAPSWTQIDILITNVRLSRSNHGKILSLHWPQHVYRAFIYPLRTLKKRVCHNKSSNMAGCTLLPIRNFAIHLLYIFAFEEIPSKNWKNHWPTRLTDYRSKR